ncbi:MAG: NUDIX hydrolase [Candidatus Limnocylindria bacterium]
MPATTNLIVSAIVRRDDRLLLVEQQAPGDPEPSWMLPGGQVEPGETLVAALARELAEETGLVLTGPPQVAFVVDLTIAAGRYSALSFACHAEGSLAPADPDALVRSAAFVDPSDAFERLRCVEWYDCAPLERFLSGEATAGTVYVRNRA